MTACAPAPDLAPAPRFYHANPDGSESQFNPVSEIFNEGFDILRTNSQDRHIFHRDLGLAARNVAGSVVRADATFRYYGYDNALHNEWLPLTAWNDRGGGAWVPNYESHLIGSGMVSVRMAEWYAQHGIAHPRFLSAATLMSAHFLNEMMENQRSTSPNEDAVTDLLIFDLGGLALWQLDVVQRVFSGPVQLTNWPGQPSLDVPSGTVENARQQFVLRTRLPFTSHYRLFYDFGMSSLLGVSRDLSNGDAITAAFGADAIANPVVDEKTGAKGATLRFKSGVFYDRNGSLLWSVLAGSRNDDAAFDVNVYPGLLSVGRLHPGIWMQIPRSGGLRFGVASSFGIGIGHGPER